MPEPGLPEAETLGEETLDCDLGQCPMTNTMPIRRLGILERNVTETHLVMAWVEMPSLRVLHSDQVYASTADQELGSVQYTNYSRNFTARLTVDLDGFVIDYPTDARRSTLFAPSF